MEDVIDDVIAPFLAREKVFYWGTLDSLTTPLLSGSLLSLITPYSLIWEILGDLGGCGGFQIDNFFEHSG